MKKYLILIFSLYVASASAQFNNCVSGFCPNILSGSKPAVSDWPSALNRPVWNGVDTLSWTGPVGGGASGPMVAQSRQLTTVASVNSSADGQVIEGLNVLGPVRIRHNNVTFRQSRVFAPEVVLVAIDNATKTGIVVEDVLIDGTSVNGTSGWLPEGGGGSIIRRSNIQGVVNGVLIGENAMQILDN